jgi:hypothetical protein
MLSIPVTTKEIKTLEGGDADLVHLCLRIYKKY